MSHGETAAERGRRLATVTLDEPANKQDHIVSGMFMSGMSVVGIGIWMSDRERARRIAADPDNPHAGNGIHASDFYDSVEESIRRSIRARLVQR